MLADTAKLAVDLSLNAKGFDSGLARARRSITGLQLDTSRLHSGLSKISAGLQVGLRNAALLGAGAIGFLAYNVKKGIDELSILQLITKQTDAVLASTKGVAGQTAKSIRDLANKYEDLTTIDDKVIQKGENLLLTFTNIRKKAFEPTLQAALDMSVALGIDLTSAAQSLGKALNDPEKGLVRLTRVGVTFTDAEKKKIIQLQKSGKLFEAQRLILDKLTQKFGGSAVAAADTYAGSMNRLHDAVEEARKALATALLPALTKVATKFASLLKDPAVIQKIQDFGATIAGLFSDQNIAAGGDAVKGVFKALGDLPWDVIKQGIKGAADQSKRVLDIFSSLPPGIQSGLLTLLAANKLTGGFVASGLGDLLKFALGSLKTIYATQVTVIGPGGGGPGGGVPGGGVPGGGGPGAGGIVTPAIGAGVAFDNSATMDLWHNFATQNHLDEHALWNVVSGVKDNTSNLPGAPGSSILGPPAPTLGPPLPLDLVHQIIQNTKDTVSNAQKIVDAQKWADGLLQTQTYSSKTIQRIIGLEYRAQLAGQRGNAAAAARLQARAERIARAAGTTTAAVNAGTATLKHKNFSPTINIRSSFNVSATAIANSLQRVVLGHRVGFN